MYRKAMKVLVELQFRAVSCPGVHLPAKDDVYLSVCLMSQYRKSECLPPVFPLFFLEKMTFEKVFTYAVDPGDVAVMLEDESVKIELVQLIPPVGEALACYEVEARRFLFPEPRLVPSFSGVDREVLMTRAFTFPGIAPRLEFSSRTTISECPADAETHIHRNVPMRTRATRTSRKKTCASPQRARSPPPEARTGRGRAAGDRLCVRRAAETPRSRSLPPRAADRRRLNGCHGNAQGLAQLSLDAGSSWDELRPAHSRESWPRATPSSPPSSPHQVSLTGGLPRPPLSGRLASGGPASSDPRGPGGRGGGSTSSPSVVWRSYRDHASQNGSRPGSQGMWEEVQERVRRLLTSPRAVHRLVYGATDSEVDEVLARRSISPGPP